MVMSEKNCFGIKHNKSTLGICIIGTIFIVVFYVILIVYPKFFQMVYCFGLTRDNAYITVGILNTTLLIFMFFLMFGIIRDSPCGMMIWVIGNAIVWNVNLVLCLSAVILSITKKQKQFEVVSLTVGRAITLLVFQVGWMIAICLVGRHWYVECEEIINEDHPTRLPSMRQRFRTWSTWSRAPKGHTNYKSGPSMISERMPQVVDKLMK